MARPDLSPIRILFVCSGNTCRSPMAQVLARRIAGELGMDQVEVRSAGTSTLPGMPASEGAVRAARRHGLDLRVHASAPLTREAMDWADRILVMGPGHLERVRELGGGGKAALLGAFAAGEDPGGGEGGTDMSRHAVPDPFGGNDDVYESTFMTLERYVGLALIRIRLDRKNGEGGEGSNPGQVTGGGAE